MLFFRPSRNIPPLEEIYQRERRVQHLLNRVRRGQDPRLLDTSGGQPSFAEMYERASSASTGRAGSDNFGRGLDNSEATDRFRQIRERRLARNMSRRQYLLDRIFNRRHNPESPNRPIDDWAINRRLALQQGSARDPYGMYFLIFCL